MDETLKQVLAGVGVPFVIGLVGALLAPKPKSKPKAPAADGDVTSPDAAPRPGVLSAAILLLALAISVVGGLLWLEGRPNEQWHGLVWLPGVALVVAGIGMMIPPVLLRIAITALLLAGGTFVGLRELILAEPAAADRWVPLALVVGLYVALEWLALRRPGSALPMALGVVAGASTAIALLSGFMKLALVMASLGFALGGIGLVALRFQTLSLARGAMGLVAPLMVMVPTTALFYMRAYSDPFPHYVFAVVALAPLALLIVDRFGLRRLAIVATVVWMMSMAAVVAVALVPAVMQYQDGSGEGDLDDDPYADLYGRRLAERGEMTS